MSMRNRRRKLKGEVVSTKSSKTVKVKVKTKKRHPKYGKVIVRNKVYLAHSNEKFEPGTEVEIMFTRPISKRKHCVIV